MKYLLIAILLSGCSAVPVSQKFPEAPAQLLEKCQELKRLDDDAKLSDVAKTVTINYSSYYECAAKHDAFIEWYYVQKKIFESLK